MGLIALPVSPHGLSVLLGQDEPAPAEGEEGSTVDMSTLREKIKQMQLVLEVPQTGELDDVTRAKLKDFQWSKNLPETGFPDSETVKALEQYGADLSELMTMSARAGLVWSAYKWWLVGGAAAIVCGGAAIWYSRKKR